MNELNMRDASRKEWTNAPTLEALKVGALLRIADAVEVLQKNWSQLIEERDAFKRLFESERRYSERLLRSNRGLRSAITRAKRQGAK